MRRGLWVDVTEDNALVILVFDLAGYFTVHDLLEEGLTHLEPVGILLLGLADLGGGSGFLELKVFASVAYVGCRIYRAKPVH